MHQWSANDQCVAAGAGGWAFLKALCIAMAKTLILSGVLAIPL